MVFDGYEAAKGAEIDYCDDTKREKLSRNLQKSELGNISEGLRIVKYLPEFQRFRFRLWNFHTLCSRFCDQPINEAESGNLVG